ncbi:MAG: nitrogenase iron protein NifH [Nitrospirota bacterium]
MRQIAIYGKGGIGKSTTTSNLSAALSVAGYRIMQIGCDPKQDSTLNLVGGELVPTILDAIREKGEGNVRLEDCCFEGFGGVVVAEAGGPEPGIGCAGKGVMSALQLLERLDAYRYFDIDIVIYDVLGDVVCGGFAMPMREGFAREIYIVTSGEMMSLYAANNICKAIKRFAENGVSIKLGGLICNSRNTIQEEGLVSGFAEAIQSRLLMKVPRSHDVQLSESKGMTVIEALPESNQAQAYGDLATAIMENNNLHIPSPIGKDTLNSLLKEFSFNPYEEKAVGLSI